MASTTVQSAESISKRFPKSDIGAAQWVQLTGGAAQISAAGDGSFWVLSPDGPSGGLNAADKYIYHNVNGVWTNVGGAAAHISAAQDGSLWVVNSLGGIYHNINNTWYAIAGGAKDISVVPDGTIYVISKAPGNAGIYHYDGTNWTQLPGGGTTIAASPDSANHGIFTAGGFWVTNSFGEIYYYSPGTGYTQLSGKAAQIAPTKNGGIFVLGYPVSSSGNPLYYNNLDTGVWTQIPGGAVNLATDTTNLYAIGGSGGIYRTPVIAAQPTPSPVPTSITINAGGTYSGSWQSLDSAVPAVTVATTDAVTIENCTIRSKADLIYARLPNTHVTIRNCFGYGLDPMVQNQARGSFYTVYEPGSITMEHNSIESTGWGLQTLSQDGWRTSGPFLVRYNTAKNLDGAPSDGRGGRITTNLPFGGDNGNHFAIFATLQGMTRAEIGWNQVITDPTPALTSIGDVINIYSSSGTPTSPIDVHDNYIQGGYPADPFSPIYYGGGIVTDGRVTDTATTATAFVKIHDNQVVSHASYSYGLAAGHDVEMYNNRTVSSGQYSSGAWYDGYVGLSIINNYKMPAGVFFNNFAHDNLSGYQFEFAYGANPNVFSPPIIRQDYIFTDCAGGATGAASKCTNNISLPGLPALITPAMESAEFTIWQQKKASNGIVIGPQSIARAAATSGR